MSSRPLVLATLALAACGHASEREQPLSNHAPPPAPGRLAVGDYACKIAEGGYDYPAFHCVVSQRPEGLWLEKVQGSVRFRGTVTASAGGFVFDGEMYCPWGDCTEHVHSQFVSTGERDTFRGTMESTQSGPSTVTLSFVPRRYVDAAFGGDGYGADGYGGAAYGGAAYGAYLPDKE